MFNRHLNSTGNKLPPIVAAEQLYQLRELVNSDLTPILNLASHPSPFVKTLIEYVNTVDDRLAVVANADQCSANTADQLLSRLPSEQIRLGYNRVIARIQRETTYFAELADVGVAEIISGDLERVVDGATIRFFVETECRDTELIQSRRALGGYNPDKSLVLVHGQEPSDMARLRALVLVGALPPEVAVIDHELTHHVQHRALSPDTVLAEVHAYIAQADSPSYFQPRLDERHEVILHVLRLFGTTPDCKDRITRAYDHIKALKLFGLCDKKVGEIVGTATFDQTSKTYPLLRSRLLELLDEHQIDRDILGPTIKALKARHAIELHVHRAKARTIAHQELLRLVDATE